MLWFGFGAHLMELKPYPVLLKNCFTGSVQTQMHGPISDRCSFAWQQEKFSTSRSLACGLPKEVIYVQVFASDSVQNGVGNVF